MTRRLLFALLAASALSTPACNGDSVVGLGAERDPLFFVRGKVTGDLSRLTQSLSGGPIRAGLLWTGSPPFVPYCHEAGPTPLDPGRTISEVARHACRDPFEVVPNRSGPSVEVDPSTGEFAIPIVELPEANLMVGPVDGRVAYASVVVYVDRDNSGALDLGRRCGIGRGGGGGPGGPNQFDNLPEEIWASSFYTLTTTQTRVTFVEGAFDASSFFYPHPGCSSLPPQGFSIWEVGDYLEPDGDCRVFDFDHVIELAVRDAPNRNLSCRPSENESFLRPPPDDITPSEILWECTAEGTIAAISAECPCPGIRTYGLSGCYDEIQCDVPDWDLTADPPPEWPCRLPD